MSKSSGYDKYLEFQFRETGNFYSKLFDLIAIADFEYIEKLRLIFPEEVDAYQTFTRIGQEAFLAKCTKGHPLIEQMEFES